MSDIINDLHAALVRKQVDTIIEGLRAVGAFSCGSRAGFREYIAGLRGRAYNLEPAARREALKSIALLERLLTPLYREADSKKSGQSKYRRATVNVGR